MSSYPNDPKDPRPGPLEDQEGDHDSTVHNPTKSPAVQGEEEPAGGSNILVNDIKKIDIINKEEKERHRPPKPEDQKTEEEKESEEEVDEILDEE